MLKIVGIHHIESPEPCHLIEVEFPGALGEEFAWGEITQEADDLPPSQWQVPYDEQPLDDSLRRWAFFFHYLDFERPIKTPFGEITLPPESCLPHHLKHIEYWPVD